MADELGLFDAMHTQRALRYIRPDPIPAALVRKVLEAGTRAPSGGNQQRWRFIVIKDAETKRWIQQRCRNTPVPGHAVPRNEAEARTMARNDAAANHLAEHLHEVPVLILCCLQHDGSPSDINRSASIYPRSRTCSWPRGARPRERPDHPAAPRLRERDQGEAGHPG